MATSENSNIKSRIHYYLISRTNFLEVKDKLNEDQLRTFVDQSITNLCQESKLVISIEERVAVIRELVSSITSLGPIRPLAEDPTVSEIMINGAKSIYIQRAGKIEKTGPCAQCAAFRADRIEPGGAAEPRPFLRLHA